MDAFSIEATFPPSLQDNPLIAMFTVMSFWAVVLICLQWVYEILDVSRDQPAPSGSYIHIARRVRFWLVMSALSATLPRLIQLMLWQKLSPAMRELVSSITWITIIPCAAMVVYAWWSNKRLVATERSFSMEHGFVSAEKATRQEKTRGIILLVGIFVIAFATTFVRPNTDAASGNPHIEQRKG